MPKAVTFGALARRGFLALAAAATLAPAAGHAQGNWPSKPIRIIVPFAAGGSNDNIARVFAVKLGERLGQPVIVENKAGSGGAIGTDYVAKSLPDGYTLMIGSSSLTTNAASGKKLPFDPVKDLQPISLICASPFAIVVNNDMKVKSLRELLELANAKPKSISYGSAGVGGMNHLATELFASTANVQLLHVPYKGISMAFTDLMGGNLQLLLPSLASAAQQMHAGKMRGLAVTSAYRSPLAPDIPTATEAGLPGFRLEVWFGLLGPAKMPAEVIRRLNQEVKLILAMPDIKELLAREGATPEPDSPEQFGALIRTDLTRWSRLIKERNIPIE